MTVNNYATCRLCGYEHTTAGDRLACDARHGRLHVVEDVRNPPMTCLLCGHEDTFGALMVHMRDVHGNDTVVSGRLVR